jgi:hypothetical protein
MKKQNNSTSKTQARKAQPKKQNKPTSAQTTPQPKAQPVRKQKEAESVKLTHAEHKAKYDQFISLKFLELSGAKLTEEKSKANAVLEAELMQCSGVKPIKTMTAAIGNEIVRMIAGLPLPEHYEEIIRRSTNPAHYIG